LDELDELDELPVLWPPTGDTAISAASIPASHRFSCRTEVGEVTTLISPLYAGFA
jgi:hypothetical protein